MSTFPKRDFGGKPPRDELSGGNVEVSGSDLVTSVAGASAIAYKTINDQCKAYIVKLLAVSFAKLCEHCGVIQIRTGCHKEDIRKHSLSVPTAKPVLNHI